MGRWSNVHRAMAAELFLLAYAMAWVVALLVTHGLTN